MIYISSNMNGMLHLLLTSIVIITFLHTTCASLSSKEINCAKFNQTIYSYHMCDNVVDCGDGSDEDSEQCQKRDCTKEDFKCMNGQCIPKTWACDRITHCADESDESPSTCRNTTCDPKTEFRCDSGKCILRGSICNTEKDCPTGYEDEEETLCYKRCAEGEEKCKSGQCVLSKYFCDGERHCVDGWDEYLTACLRRTCKAGEFRCDNALCIRNDMKCTEKGCINETNYKRICDENNSNV